MRSTMLIGVAVFAWVTAPTTTAHAQSEVWIGTAPSCAATPSDCTRRGMDYVRSDKSGGGSSCWSGTKVLCRARPQTTSNDIVEVWIGTGPTCSASAEDCTRSGLTFVRADASGDGARCLTGTKVLCRGQRSSYRPQPEGVQLPATSCPEMAMKCPTGESFTRGTSWDGSRMCRPSNAMSTVLNNKCPRPYAGDTRIANEESRTVEANWNDAANQPQACNAEKGDFSIRGPYSELFNDACIIHDLCYRTARGKSTCDVEFLANMQAVCYKVDALMLLGGMTVGACLAAANAGWIGVNTLGQESYNDAQKTFHLTSQPPSPSPSPPPPTPTPSPPPAQNNLALNKPTNQSSTAFGGDASRAVDGNMDGNYNNGSVTHSDLENGAWWMVDLGAEYQIQNVTVYNRTDCCSERLSAMVLVAGRAEWPQRSVRAQRPISAQPVSTAEFGTASGRYIYIVSTSNNYLSLAEVVVTGTQREAPALMPAATAPASPSGAAVVRVQSVNYPNNFFHVRGSLAYIDPAQGNISEFEFDMVPGLGDPNALSFRSRVQANHYLRHANHVLQLNPNDGGELFAKDATFRMVPGLSGNGSSFESVNYPSHFVRHANFQLYLQPNDGTQLFAQDASFILQRIR